MSASSSNSKGCLAASIATGLLGFTAGSLSFVSFVDVRSFLKHVDSHEKNPEHYGDIIINIIKSHFQVWWPCGRDYMVPLLGCTTIANAATWFLTKDVVWLLSGGCVFLIGPYTGMVLGEDIEKLRRSENKEVVETTRRFCALHHVRLGMAVTGFVLSLYGMGKQFQKK